MFVLVWSSAHPKHGAGITNLPQGYYLPSLLQVTLLKG